MNKYHIAVPMIVISNIIEYTRYALIA